MQITALGCVLLPLGLLWMGKPMRLLQLAFIAAIFEAGAAFVVGGNFGFPPAMVPGLILIGSIMLQYALGMRYRAEAAVFHAMTPLLALLGYAVISEMILPSAFSGSIMVSPQKPDPLGPALVPLAFNAGNVTQPLYLAMNISVAIATALLVSQGAISKRGIMRAYLLSGYLAVGLTFWQFASRVAGVPYPSELLYTNPGWQIVEQSLGPVPRIQGPFSEPAGLAFYLAGLCFCCLWMSAQGHRIMRVNFLLALAILAILLSTSTTGILTLAGGIPAVLLFAALRGSHFASARLARNMALLLLGGCLLLGPVFVLRPTLLDAIDVVATATMTKGDSDSYTDRTGLDDAALASIGPTYGLGVGWGGFRTSSLLPGIIANAGLFGLAVVLWGFARVTRLLSRARVASRQHSDRCVLDGFSASLCGQLGAALLSAPTIGSLGFFLQLGCLVGTAAGMTTDARRLRLPQPVPHQGKTSILAQMNGR